MKEIHGVLDGKGKRFGIVVSRFNEFFSRKLLEGALDCLTRHGVNGEDIRVYWVPGAFEIPQMARKLSKAGDLDGIICLGAVIRGATPHFDYIAAEVTKGVSQVALESDSPVVFGVITCDTIEQAVERSGSKSGNKGYQAAEAALEMADLVRRI